MLRKKLSLNYSETIEYLYHSLPMFSRTGPKGFKPDLKKTVALCEHLGNPEKKFKSVHIAGTNGKGSVSNMLAAIFREHGYKTGLYTSPHLRDFRERIRINGKMISRTAVVEFVRRTYEFSREIKPSFFELTFAMAMDYFAAQKVDIAIIETGLGGRLDSTNVITPALSIITNIGMDHTDVLGDTLEKIAFEKAGIIKENVPVVIGEFLPETKPVFLKKAGEKNSPIYFASDNLSICFAEQKSDYTIGVSMPGYEDIQVFHTDMRGIYQQQNLLTVLQSVLVLQEKFNLTIENIHSALSSVTSHTGLEGRWQTVHENPCIILDVAHNADGIRMLMKQLADTTFNQLHIVLGMVKDKDHETVLSLLPANAHYYFTNAQIPRALPASELEQKAKSFHLLGSAYADVNLAVRTALEKATPADLILVCGSVFIVGEFDQSRVRTTI